MRVRVTLALMMGFALLTGCGSSAPPAGNNPPLPKQEEMPAKAPYSDTQPAADPKAPPPGK